MAILADTTERCIDGNEQLEPEQPGSSDSCQEHLERPDLLDTSPER